MANQNGQLVLKALQDLDEPVTVTKIVTHIAETAGVHPNDVKDSVMKTLQGGLRYGYVQKNNRKYFAATLDVDGISDADAENSKMSDGSEGSGEPEDKARRRRRGGRRRRSSRRRGSRRSRSRSNRSSRSSY